MLQYPFTKPTGLISPLLQIATEPNEDAIILDFFGGSGTVMHAVLELNQKDGGNRRVILVQLPEHCDENSDAYKEGLKTVADIGKERIRRVIKKIKDESDSKLGFEGDRQDLAFKVYKLSGSNFKIWDTGEHKTDKDIEKQLELHVDHIDPKSTQEDILYELLLKSGFDLATKIEKLSLASRTVYSIADGAMLVCLEEKLTKELINAMAEMKPSRVICLDKGFKDNDQLKANAGQIMKSKKVNTFLTV